MSEEYRFKDRIKDIINGDVDYDKLRKAEKQGWIDRADTGFPALSHPLLPWLFHCHAD